jgi:histone chaperone ASF1
MYVNSDIEWKLIFVPSTERTEQELDNCMLGPLSVGIDTFDFESAALSPALISNEDILGVTVLFFTGIYKDQEFIRVHYYQSMEYDNEEMRLNPPAQPEFDHLIRTLSHNPKVTKFDIQW